MRHLVIAAAASVALAVSSVPGSAAEGRNTAAAVGAVGGFALGTMLGSALAGPRPVYVTPQPVYVEPVEVYEECRVRRERVYVPGWGWEVRHRRVCY
jgi:hypothetical protein